jgi:hypothetical protein
MKKVLFTSTITLLALLYSSLGMAGNHSNTTSKVSCADAVNHKHPGLKGDAWKTEWSKCANDRQGYTAQ